MELWLNWFLKGIETFEIDIDSEKIEKFKKYLELIIFYNQKFNLTGEKTKEEIAIKQFLDSLIPLIYIKKCKEDFKIFNNSIDIGTGAGIPSIPLKILFNDIILYLIESNKKRVFFLNEVIEKLKLKDIFILNGRGEELIKIDGFREILREKFTSVFARWVLKVPGIFELTSPFVKINGKIFLWKGVDEIKLIEKSKSFLIDLGLSIEETFNYELPYFKSERILLVLKKINKTPEKYPRSFRKIKNLTI